jgi:1,2-dihydroxy-3-keto-5-methylthiopentene dioxygenase
MAIVNIPDKELTLKNPEEIKNYLAGIGIDYERWDAGEARVSPDATEAEILEAYAPEIERLKEHQYCSDDAESGRNAQ